jgi:hypothetical protein
MTCMKIHKTLEEFANCIDCIHDHQSTNILNFAMAWDELYLTLQNDYAQGHYRKLARAIMLMEELREKYNLCTET